ncbi:MAG: hypothetical protein MZW92_10335 [Comamonadaceae bacterium]|nr:hypothetical protein [Comamonadaceae bacterium]
MEARDKAPVLGLVRATGFFTEPEVGVAEELMDIYLGQPGQKDYQVVVVENEAGGVAGYMTWGPTPLAEDAYDLYWMAVAPSEQGRAGPGARPLARGRGPAARTGGSSSSRPRPSPSTTARDGSTSISNTRKSPGSRISTGPGTIASSTRSIFVRSDGDGRLATLAPRRPQEA